MKNIQKCQYYYVLQQYLTKNSHEAYNKLDQAYETSEKPTISPANYESKYNRKGESLITSDKVHPKLRADG